MAYLVEITPRAENDLAQIYRRIARAAPYRGPIWFDRFEGAIQSLSNFPERLPELPKLSSPGRIVRQLLFGRRRQTGHAAGPAQSEKATVRGRRADRSDPLPHSIWMMVRFRAVDYTVSFDHLADTDFERFTYDLLEHKEFFNLNWRKGTGLSTSPADNGRDIVAETETIEVDGARRVETWFIDCKRFKKGVPPKELQNLLNWATAERPDVVLFVVSNFLSNPAKTFLENYRRNNNPPFRIKYWELPQLQRLAPKILLRKYGATDEPIKSLTAILKAESEFYDRVWYDRHKLTIEMHRSGKRKLKRDVLRSAKKGARAIEKRYGKKNLGPYSDVDWGILLGKLQAMRWILGDGWISDSVWLR